MSRVRSALVGVLATGLGVLCLVGCSDAQEDADGGLSTQLTIGQIHQKMALLGRHFDELMARGIIVDSYGPNGDGRILVVLDEHTASGSFAAIRDLLGSEGLFLKGHGVMDQEF